MTLRYKSKKVNKRRGNRFHGWGRGHAHHKGAGNRGGRGNAGSGKRADAKKPTFQKMSGSNYLGRRGFFSITRAHVAAVNVGFVCKHVDKWASEKLVEKKGDTFIVDLSKLNYNKLLGSGIVDRKLEISTVYASGKAIEKISAKGGKVNAEIVTEKKSGSSASDADEDEE